jgi:hypothetical protein
MVDVIGRAKVVVVSDVDQSSVNSSGQKVGAGLKAGAAVGVAALGSLAAAGVKAVVAFEEAESVQRKLTNTLGNMGQSGAVEELDRLSEALMRKTGVDDEVIKSGQTILATFSEVAASAGETGGAFERASVASLDLAATGFGSVDAASKSLGKALQDPEKGIAALSRAGVTFTQTQKDQIANFVETGRVAEAQNIILSEVEKQVGGNAEAARKASETLKSAIGEAQESLGGLIADLFETGEEKSIVDLAADATFKFSDAVQDFQGSKDWKAIKSDIRTFGKDLQTVSGAIGSIVRNLDKLSRHTTGRGALPNFVDALMDVANQVVPLRRLADAIEVIADAWDRLAEARANAVTGDDVPDAPDISQPRETRAGGGRTTGLTLVGESGPELVEFGSSGGYVHNNSETRAIASSAGSTIVTNYNLYGPESLSQARRDNDWDQKYGTRFGAATQAAAL